MKKRTLSFYSEILFLLLSVLLLVLMILGSLHVIDRIPSFTGYATTILLILGSVLRLVRRKQDADTADDDPQDE